jgi:hypothetical protein
MQRSFIPHFNATYLTDNSLIKQTGKMIGTVVYTLGLCRLYLLFIIISLFIIFLSFFIIQYSRANLWPGAGGPFYSFRTALGMNCLVMGYMFNFTQPVPTTIELSPFGQ